MTEIGREQLERSLSGDRSALRTLCEALYPTVQHAVASVLRYHSATNAERDDLVQEVFRYLLDNDARPLRLWDPDRVGGRSLRSWVGMIAGRHAGRLARKRRTSVGEPFPEDGVDPAESGEFPTALLRRDLLDKLMERLEADLSVEELALFRAVFVEARTATDVAEDLSLAANTVHKRCQRLRAKVSSIAQDMLGEGQAALAGLALLLLLLQT